MNGSISSVPIPVSNTKYEPTNVGAMKSLFLLNALVAKFAGRIIFHISASNWAVVFHRLRTKLHFLASDFDREKVTPDLVDLRLLSHSALNRERLLAVLQGMPAVHHCPLY
jgi:neurofibromin 1